ncbi:MAG: N-acetyl-gamma-glutamyl-phosphate reductase [Candidatus Limnocylindrales bacterium]
MATTPTPRTVHSPPVSAAAEPIRVGIVGATGYVGGELIRILHAHPGVQIVGLTGRERSGDPVGTVHPHLARTSHALHETLTNDVDAVFLALPHGVAAERVPAYLEAGVSVIDLGPDFRLRNPADYPRWYGFEHPHPELLAQAVYGLPELHRPELIAASVNRVAGSPALVGAPGCYPTATLLGLAPLARAGLVDDVIVDAKSGVSGAGREANKDMLFAEVNESVRAYGIFSHRHTAEMEQELGTLQNAGVRPIDFLPHLIPMTRGILSACHVRPTRPVTQAELDALYAEAYEDEPFVAVVGRPPATGHVLGSNHAQVFVRADERTGRILALGVIDNLVKGAAGQAIQAFNLVFGLDEAAGLDALPLAP